MADFSTLENVAPELWDKYVESSDQGTIFLKLDFVKSLKLNFKTYIVNNGGQPVAGCMVLLDEQGKIISAPYHYVAYQGFFFINENKEDTNNEKINKHFEITEYLMNYLVSVYGDVSQIHFNLQDYRPFLWHNYHTPEKGTFSLSLRYTSLLNLQSLTTVEEYLANIRRLRRREYVKANKLCVTIEDSTDAGILVMVNKLTFERQGIQLNDMEQNLILSITRDAIEKKYGVLQVAMLDGKAVSALLTLWDSKRAYHLIGGTDPEYRDSGAYTFVIIDNIFRSKAMGLKEVDFVGCNSPFRGDYKTSFNGQLVTYYQTDLKACSTNTIESKPEA